MARQLVVNRAEEHPRAKLEKGYTRMDMPLGANMMRRLADDPSKTEFTLITHVNPVLPPTRPSLPSSPSFCPLLPAAAAAAASVAWRPCPRSAPVWPAASPALPPAALPDSRPGTRTG
jgi:hypothetical protein